MTVTRGNFARMFSVNPTLTARKPGREKSDYMLSSFDTDHQCSAYRVQTDWWRELR